jgi:phospholipid/cholesterol/gamma-HCH transport system ATP-binding protein
MRKRISLESVVYQAGTAKLLDDVNFSIEAGAIIMITGPGGSGKSTFLEICASLKKPSRGTILWNGQDVLKMSPARRLAARKSTGFLFQTNALISNLSVSEHLALPLRYHTQMSAWEISEKTRERMSILGIENIAGRRPEELSSEESRRAALARALIMEPEMLFLDSPTAGVDPVAGNFLLQLILTERRRRTMTVIIASHSLSVAKTMECPVLLLDKGNLAPFKSETEKY